MGIRVSASHNKPPRSSLHGIVDPLPLVPVPARELGDPVPVLVVLAPVPWQGKSDEGYKQSRGRVRRGRYSWKFGGGGEITGKNVWCVSGERNIYVVYSGYWHEIGSGYPRISVLWITGTPTKYTNQKIWDFSESWSKNLRLKTTLGQPVTLKPWLADNKTQPTSTQNRGNVSDGEKVRIKKLPLINNKR